MFKSCSKCGKIHSFSYKCKEGFKPDYKYSYEESKLRNTNDWHKKAEDIKRKSKYLCSVCYDKGIYQYNDLETHHIVKIRDDKSKLLDDYNLICLCRSCHKLADVGMIDKEYLLKLAREREDRI